MFALEPRVSYRKGRHPMNRTGTILALAVAATLPLLVGCPGMTVRAETAGNGPAPTGHSAPATNDDGGQPDMAKATFGAGCFWGVEAAFRKTPGVTATQVGYSGGDVENPTYKEVCSDTTGHAEVVEVTYNPEKVTYEELLKVFWESHNPTQVNRQGPDVGSQYRSVIFYHDDAQKAAAEASKKALDESGKLGKPVATAIEPARTFWRAEEYHQQYLEKKGLASCHI
jgi:peptide-methionine (S)-S-oxide reductase